MLLLRVVISRALINWHLVSAPAVAAAEEGNHQRIRVDQAMMLMHDFQYPRRGMTISILDSIRTFLSVCLYACLRFNPSACVIACVLARLRVSLSLGARVRIRQIRQVWLLHASSSIIISEVCLAACL